MTRAALLVVLASLSPPLPLPTGSTVGRMAPTSSNAGTTGARVEARAPVVVEEVSGLIRSCLRVTRKPPVAARLGDLPAAQADEASALVAFGCPLRGAGPVAGLAPHVPAEWCVHRAPLHELAGEVHQQAEGDGDVVRSSSTETPSRLDQSGCGS
jgi:hypothetical protein